MTLERKIASVFHLTDERWMRHANPISVWTRYSVLPIIVMALWSRVWIAGWCLIPILLAIAWMMVNPIIFKKPKTTKSWASKAVLGERVYLNRDHFPLPSHHRLPLYNLLNILALLGLIIAIVATIYYSIWGAVFGVGITLLAKSWFLDRMVWLYEDMKSDNEIYRSWEY